MLSLAAGLWTCPTVAMYSPNGSVTVTGISTLCSGCNLSFAAILWKSGFVKRNFTIRRLLAILVVAGLALAPVSRPVMAPMSPDTSMQIMTDEMSAAETMDEMAG